MPSFMHELFTDKKIIFLNFDDHIYIIEFTLIFKDVYELLRTHILRTLGHQAEFFHATSFQSILPIGNIQSPPPNHRSTPP